MTAMWMIMHHLEAACFSNYETIYSMDYTEQEYKTLQDMLQHYREFQEELYGYPDETTLFTATQLRLFRRFSVVSIKCNGL